MKARALLIEALVGIASAAVAAGAFCWMVKYTVLKEADMIVIAAFLWLWVACKLLVEPLSQEFEQTVQLIQDTKEQVNNLVWQELRCKEELRAEEQQERKQDPQWVNE